MSYRDWVSGNTQPNEMLGAGCGYLLIKVITHTPDARPSTMERIVLGGSRHQYLSTDEPWSVGAVPVKRKQGADGRTGGTRENSRHLLLRRKEPAKRERARGLRDAPRSCGPREVGVQPDNVGNLRTLPPNRGIGKWWGPDRSWDGWRARANGEGETRQAPPRPAKRSRLEAGHTKPPREPTLASCSRSSCRGQYTNHEKGCQSMSGGRRAIACGFSRWQATPP